VRQIVRTLLAARWNGNSVRSRFPVSSKKRGPAFHGPQFFLYGRFRTADPPDGVSDFSSRPFPFARAPQTQPAYFLRPLQQLSARCQNFFLDTSYSSIIISKVLGAPARRKLLEGGRLALAIHQDALLAHNVVENTGY
jgi:hypothetical protein